MRRHTPETLGATFVLFVCGGALLYLSRARGVGSDLLSQMAAALGPVALVLGLGMAIHGRDMPPTHVTVLARVWGLIGSIAAVVNLWMLGYFRQGGPAGRAIRWLAPLALLGAWLLPARAYGAPPAIADKGEE